MLTPTINPAHAHLLRGLRERIISANPEQGWIIDNLAVLHIGGSTLYGTSTPQSDLDLRGIAIAPKSYWVGARRFESLERQSPEEDVDIVIYDIRKWLNLTVAVNPNVVETLFVADDSDCMVLTTDAWRCIRAETLSLLNLRAYAGYHGYTTSQLKKMVVKQSNKTGRREISDEFGFDLKFASHGFRLARQGAELLRTGRITFPRPDREHLAAVRFGKVYGPGDLDACVRDLEAAIQELDAAYAISILPEKADFERYDRLLMEIYDRYVTAES